MKSSRVLTVSAWLCSLALLGCDRSVPQRAAGAMSANGPKTNVVLISVDMLRPDHLGCYGYKRNTSPRIDQLAAEGVLFENAVSSTSWTLPAHAALMTGLLDSAHGSVDTTKPLAERHHTMAERFRALGYETAGFFSGPYLHPAFGLGQGFDTYVDCRSNAGDSGHDAPIEGIKTWQDSHRDVTNPTVYGEVKKWLTRRHDRPFFVFIHLWDVHYDFIPPPPYDRMFDADYDGPFTGASFLFNQWINAAMPRRDLDHLLALYDGEIAWTDKHVGMILDDLDALGVRDSTLLALVADHGTEFFEHGDKSHRKSLFDEAIRIPMLIRYPGVVAAGVRVKDQVSIIDVLPTVAELVGAPGSTDVMGESLVPLLKGQSLPRDDLAVSELFSNARQMRAFRRADRKVIKDFTTGCTWVYDLQADPGELRPILSSDSAAHQAGRRDATLAETWLAEFSSKGAAANPLRRPNPRPGSEVPPAVLQQLQSLGYVGGEEE